MARSLVEDVFEGVEVPKAAPAPAAPAAPASTVEVRPVPAGLAGREARLWIVRQEIEATRFQLAQARANPALAGRTGTLQGELRKLLENEAELEPPEVHSQDEEDRKWRAEGEAVLAKIEAGVKAVEERIRRAG